MRRILSSSHRAPLHRTALGNPPLPPPPPKKTLSFMYLIYHFSFIQNDSQQEARESFECCPHKERTSIDAYLFARRRSQITRLGEGNYSKHGGNCSEAAAHKENRLGVTGSPAVRLRTSKHARPLASTLPGIDRRNLLFTPSWPAFHTVKQSVCLLIWPPFEQKTSVSSRSPNKTVQSTGK